MQGIQAGFSRTWVTQLPLSAAANAHRVVSFALSHPSLLNRGRRAVISWRWQEESYRGRDSSPLFEEKQRAYHELAATSLQVWRRSRALSKQIAFERYDIPLRQRSIMTTMSIAATHEGGGRQLRRRKETHISMSSSKVVANSSVNDNKQNRKKSAKAAAASSPPVDDYEDGGDGGGDPFAGSLEAKLWNLDKTDQLTSLTVVELRGLMKQISKPTAGRKEELISEVKRWLAERKAVATKGDGRRGGTRESSSDAESLEGALLKAESKARMAPMPLSNGEGITKKYPQKLPVEVDSPVSDVKLKTSRKAAAVDSSDEDFEPPLEEKKKTTKPRKGKKSSKVDKVSDESAEDEGDVEAVAVVQKRKATKVTKTVQAKKTKLNEEDEETPLPVAAGEAWKILAHKKPQSDWVVYNPYEMRPAPPPAGSETVKLVSWNVNGLRALMKDKINKKQESLLLTNFAKEENFDVLCLQETKLQEKDIEEVGRTILAGYFDDTFWSCSTSKLGYSGTAVFSKIKPVSVAYGMGIVDHDAEGRLITVEFDSFFLLTTYVPNSGEKLDRLSYRTEEWDIALSKYIKGLEEQKPVILTGDLNCANEPIDIYNPDGNKKSAGYTQEERTSFKTNFLEQGLVDTFRQRHPNALGYSYWGYRSGARAKNQGWRLDYFLVSEALVDKVHDSYICPDVLGSDHCPIGLILNL